MPNLENMNSYIGDTSSLASFQRLMNRYNLIPEEELKELFFKLKNNDEKSDEIKERIIMSNLRLVSYIAKKIAVQMQLTKKIEDLIQYGTIGLMKAIDKFDVTIDAKFPGYAVYWIQQSIKRSIDNNERMIRLPVHTVEKLNKIFKAKAELSQILKREPTLKEIADRINIPVEQVQQLKEFEYRINVRSLDNPLKADNGDEDFSPLEEFISDSIDEIEQSENRIVLQQAFKVLDEKEKYVVKKYFMERNNYNEISAKLGLTPQRVAQIAKISLKKLKNELSENYNIEQKKGIRLQHKKSK